MTDKGSDLLERVTLIFISLVLAYFVGLRLGWLPLFWGVTFLLIVAMLLLANVFWWAWVDRQLRSSNPGPRSPACRRLLRWGWGGFMLLMLSPLVWWMFKKRGVWDAYPAPLIMSILIWHLLMVLLVTVWTPLVGLRVVLKRLLRRPARASAGDDSAGSSRREFLKRAVAMAPMVVTGGSLGAAAWQDGRFMIRRVTTHLPRLPKRLAGLTITHISDLHLGRLFRPEYLPRLVDAVNGLKSDVIAVTGDIVDHSVDFMPAACDALARMESRCGRFVVVGNHDLLDSPAEAVAELNRREPFLLIDRLRPVLIDGETIQVAGLFWSRYDEPKDNDPGHAGRVAATLSGGDRNRFTIALAHHPHAFDPLASRGVDLTLAGHTHGGQLMLTPPGSRVPIGGGSLLFRYIWGEYRQGESVLQVTSGVGNWFPVRINAPAEIVQYRLV